MRLDFRMSECILTGVARVTYETNQSSLMSFDSKRSAATPGQDFIAVNSGFIDIANGTTSGTISITIVNDDIPEIDEVSL